MTLLSDAVVLVTGANGGLGTEFVHQALARGAAKVYATARHPRSWEDDRIVPLALDVTDAASIAGAAEAASDVTVLVNNAGIAAAHEGALAADADELRRLLETNVVGLYAVTRAFAPAVTAAKGAVLNVGSIASWRSLPILAPYAATKAAVWSLTDSTRRQLGPDGVQVVGLYLAFADTPMAAFARGDKLDPADVVRQAYDGIESGVLEVLADQRTRDVRAGLSELITT